MSQVEHEDESARLMELTKRVLNDVLEEVVLDREEELLLRVVALVQEEVARERQRCVKLCAERAELWRDTAGAQSPILAAREEARSRANEARVLADLIELGE